MKKIMLTGGPAYGKAPCRALRRLFEEKGGASEYGRF